MYPDLLHKTQLKRHKIIHSTYKFAAAKGVVNCFLMVLTWNHTIN